MPTSENTHPSLPRTAPDAADVRLLRARVPQPTPHHGCLAEIRRLRAQLRVADRRATYAAGYADGYRAGRDAGRLADAYAEPSYAEIETRRWELRGEPRTRAEFGAPHPLDRIGAA